ncbi:MAG: hypothetical protein PHQ66_02840 [Candidatus Nanoarchaeia archaeon]|nr:hypothetical protein [Candidatus Nanoarchaeia archaeon]MDD5357698.1 hypothetical protein [Candidatus Nanoarchaeia archaeon]MDD5588617.1 hypothetical protein [Candidatus Nanoarchaeia archaeon]
MLSQALRDKRGLSLVIGYILLIAISVVMSVIVYQWLRTYVPTESVECDEGVSIFINDVSYDCTAGNLEVTTRNNGKFSVNGYFIRASNNSEGLATIDLSLNILGGYGGSIYGNTNSISFSNETCVSDCENSLTPTVSSNVKSLTFNVSSYGGNLVKIEIIPTRIQEIDNKKRLVSCGGAKIEETLVCE